MPATEFLDTNIIIYAYSTDAAKKSAALDLLAESPVISTQVLNETAAVFHRKKLMTSALIGTAIDDLSAWCHINQLSIGTIKLALYLTDRYKFAYYDALIVASAMESECTVLYSEDMQHGQIVANRLRIANPFLP
jgi:predicted nucleic acid-binding protein